MTSRQAILLAELARPGLQMILQELDIYAENLKADYDNVDFASEPGRAMHIQITRDVIKNGIPRILNKIMADPEAEVKWSFKRWLASIGTRFNEFNDYQ